MEEEVAMLLNTIKTWLILFLLVVLVSIVFRLYAVSNDRDLYKAKVEAVVANSVAENRAYRIRMKSYDDAMESIGKFLGDKLKMIEDFEGRPNETECQAANRLLNRHGH